MPRQRLKLFRILVNVQSAYTFLTAIWPIIHITSFLAVTGYKTDVWLVKTVGALLLPISITLFLLGRRGRDKRAAVVLGGLTAALFVWIDFYYSAIRDIIPDIYQLDGIVELMFLGGWMYLAAYRWRELGR